MRSLLSCLLAAALVSAACESKSPVAYGGANSVIAVAPERLWAAVRDTVMTALEPTIQTIRDERTFEVTHVAPTDSAWLTLRQFKQVVLIGYEGDPWMARALESVETVPDSLPAIFEVGEVWARDQAVTVVLLPRGAGVEAVARVVPELHRLLDLRFRQYVRARMFTSGVDEALRRELEGAAGFGLTLPDVYRYEQVGDSLHVFRNHYATGSTELRRAILVDWRPIAFDVSPRRLALWRDSVASVYGFEQEVGPEPLEVRELGEPGAGGLEARGVWRTPDGDWPAGGPFVARAIRCPGQNRLYLMDAWLYAPNESKYEYMLQLETILDSFRCGDAAGGRQSTVDTEARG